MKLLIAALISAALFLTLPQHQGKTPINNSTKRVQVTQAVQVATTEKVAEVQPSAQTEQQAVDSSETATVEIPEPEPNTPEAWMSAVGMTTEERQAANYIIGQESGWCPTKWQGQYGTCPAYHGAPQGDVGYGLCQATPASKMASAGDDWATNPITQLKWCSEYVQAYGGWVQAAEFKRCTGLCYSARILADTYKATPWF